MTQPSRWCDHQPSRLLAKLLVGLVAAIGVWLTADVAHAQDSAIQVQVRDQQRDGGSANNVPVPGPKNPS